MEGSNFVELSGVLKFPTLKQTNKGFPRFQAKVGVPFQFKDRNTGEEKEGLELHTITAWGELAETMGALAEDTQVIVQGELESRSYSGNCRSCGSEEKKYWVAVKATNFEVVG